jgi:hypothetical protein
MLSLSKRAKLRQIRREKGAGRKKTKDYPGKVKKDS